MKKNYILLLLLCLCFAGCKEKTVVESDYLPIADPYVMLYEGKITSPAMWPRWPCRPWC
mgnify:CR=1 FL=1